MSDNTKILYSDATKDLVKNLPIGLALKNSDLVYQECNQEFAQLLGFNSPDEIIGLSDSNLHEDEETVDLYESDDKMILSTGEAVVNFEELFFNQKLNKETCWKMSKLPYKDETGQVVGIIIACEDVTKSKVEELELERLRMEVKRSERVTKAFLSNITHSIRTPLSAIMGFTDMIAQGELDKDEIIAFADILQYNADKLNKVISDTLDVAAVEAGEMVLNPEPLDIKEFLEEEAVILQSRLFLSDKAHIEIKTELPEENSTFNVDKVRLKQVITNLIGNALQFTEAGNITLGLRMDNKKSVLVYVKDTGAGIDLEKLEIIFERFKLGGSVVEDVNSGLGLGLTICKELVNQMGGEIWVDSKAEQGSTFSFTLPTGEAETVSSTTPEKLTTEWDDSWTAKKIILADDVIYAHQFIKALLKKRNIEVISAIDGHEAINAADRHSDVALILMDIQMPRMGGIEAMEIIKEKHPDLPIVAYTAYAMVGDRELYQEKGFDDYLSKPLETSELYRVFSRFM